MHTTSVKYLGLTSSWQESQSCNRPPICHTLHSNQLGTRAEEVLFRKLLTITTKMYIHKSQFYIKLVLENVTGFCRILATLQQRLLSGLSRLCKHVGNSHLRRSTSLSMHIINCKIWTVNTCTMSCEPNQTGPYSNYLRWRMIYQAEIQGKSYRKVGENLCVDPSTGCRTVALFNATNNVDKRKHLQIQAQLW